MHPVYLVVVVPVALFGMWLTGYVTAAGAISAWKRYRPPQ
jgi:hypothetical protein